MRFNTKERAQTVLNHEGAPAFALSPAYALYTAAVTGLLSDAFYETGSERLTRLRALIAENDPIFVAKLAIYAREKMYLRSLPLVLTVELSHIVKNDGLVRKTLRRIIQRPDEITETLAYYARERKDLKKLNKLSRQIQKGIADAFNKFDEYQFAKYDRDGAIKLRDALFLAHPKPKDEAQQEIFNRIAQRTLKTPETWEVALTQAGENAENAEEKKREAWETLIDQNKMGYMALLRNLRNFLDYEVGFDRLYKVAQRLSDPEAVKNSKQLPYRFLAAYRELHKHKNDGAPMLLDALEKAALASSVNIRGFGPEENVVLACDVSGSMQVPVSKRSAIMNIDIGLILAALLKAKCANITAGIFGDTWKTIEFPLQNTILMSVMLMHLRAGEVGYSTNGYKVIEYLNKKKQKADKVLIFTDGQLWNNKGGGQSLESEWIKYKKLFPDSKLYLFDLAGYGNTPIEILAETNVYLVAGWSDKIFEVLEAFENGSDALAEIDAISIA